MNDLIIIVLIVVVAIIAVASLAWNAYSQFMPNKNILKYKGAYSATVSYSLNDVVAYNSIGYVSIAASNLNNVPTNALKWAKLGGSDGATGAAGPVGPAGPPGQAGNGALIFLAQGYNGADFDISTNQNANYVFKNILVDTNSGWNAGLKRYVFGATGYYSISSHLQVTWSPSVNNRTGALSINKNGNATPLNVFDVNGTSGNANMAAETVIQIVSGDYVSFNVSNTSSTETFKVSESGSINTFASIVKLA